MQFGALGVVVPVLKPGSVPVVMPKTLATAVKGAARVTVASMPKTASPIVVKLPVNTSPAKVAALVQKLQRPLPASAKMPGVTVAQAIAARLQGTTPGLHGLGDTAQVKSAVQLGAKGAEAGSAIVPGIGTVIGALVGVALGVIFSKKTDARPPNAKEVADAQQTLANYANNAAQSPNDPLNISYNELSHIAWCLAVAYAPMINDRYIKWYGAYWTLYGATLAEEIVVAVYNTPIGSPLNLAAISAKVRGHTYTVAARSMPNPAITSLVDIVTQVYTPAVATALRAQCDPKYQSQVEPMLNQPLWQRFFFDTLGAAARARLPNVSGADFVAALQIATGALTQGVSESAAQVVTQVQRAPGVSVPISAQITPISSSTPAVAATPVTPSTPAVTTAASGAPGIDMNALAQAMLAAGATPQQAYAGTMQQLENAGVPITPDVQQAAAQASGVTQAGGAPAGMNKWLVGGALGIAALMFMTARPRRGSRRGSTHGR